MAFKIKEIIDLKGILFLTLLIVASQATNLDCNGKAFHCVNSTHFMICVDLGRGTSTTIDDVIIPCPSPTVCRSINRFECEFVLPSTTSTRSPPLTSEKDLTRSLPEFTTSIPFEEFFNTVSSTTISKTEFQPDPPDPILLVKPITSGNDYTESLTTVGSFTEKSVLKDVNMTVGEAVVANDVNVTENSIYINDRKVQNNEITSKNLNLIPKITIFSSDQTTTTQPQVKELFKLNNDSINSGVSILNNITTAIVEQEVTKNINMITGIEFTTESITETASPNEIIKDITNESSITITEMANEQSVTTEQNFAEMLKNDTDTSSLQKLTTLMNTTILKTQDTKKFNETKLITDIMNITAGNFINISDISVNKSLIDVLSTKNTEKDSRTDFQNTSVNATTIDNFRALPNATNSTLNQDVQKQIIEEAVSIQANITNNQNNVDVPEKVTISKNNAIEKFINITTDGPTLKIKLNFAENGTQLISLETAKENSDVILNKEIVKNLVNATDASTKPLFSESSNDTIITNEEQKTLNVSDDSVAKTTVLEQSSHALVADNFSEPLSTSTARQLIDTVVIDTTTTVSETIEKNVVNIATELTTIANIINYHNDVDVAEKVSTTEKLVNITTEVPILKIKLNITENRNQLVSFEKGKEISKSILNKEIAKKLENATDSTTKPLFSESSNDTIITVKEGNLPNVVNGSIAKIKVLEQFPHAIMKDNFTEPLSASTVAQLDAVVIDTPITISEAIDKNLVNIPKEVITETTPKIALKTNELDLGGKEMRRNNSEIVTLLDLTINGTNVTEMTSQTSDQDSKNIEINTQASVVNTFVTTKELVMAVVKNVSLSEEFATSNYINKTTAVDSLQNENSSQSNILSSNDTTLYDNVIYTTEITKQYESETLPTSVVTVESAYPPSKNVADKSNNAEKSLNVLDTLGSLTTEPNPTTEGATILYNNLEIFTNSNKTQTSMDISRNNPQSDVENVENANISMTLDKITNDKKVLLSEDFDGTGTSQAYKSDSNKVGNTLISSVPLKSESNILVNQNQEKTQLFINTITPFEAQTEKIFTESRIKVPEIMVNANSLDTRDMNLTNKHYTEHDTGSDTIRDNHQALSEGASTIINKIHGSSQGPMSNETEAITMFSSDLNKLTITAADTTTLYPNFNENQVTSSQMPTNNTTSPPSKLLKTIDNVYNNLPDTSIIKNNKEIPTQHEVIFTQSDNRSKENHKNSDESGIRSIINTKNNTQESHIQEFTIAEQNTNYSEITTNSYGDRHGVIVAGQAEIVTETPIVQNVTNNSASTSLPSRLLKITEEVYNNLPDATTINSINENIEIQTQPLIIYIQNSNINNKSPKYTDESSVKSITDTKNIIQDLEIQQQTDLNPINSKNTTNAYDKRLGDILKEKIQIITDKSLPTVYNISKKIISTSIPSPLLRTTEEVYNNSFDITTVRSINDHIETNNQSVAAHAHNVDTTENSKNKVESNTINRTQEIESSKSTTIKLDINSLNDEITTVSYEEHIGVMTERQTEAVTENMSTTERNLSDNLAIADNFRGVLKSNKSMDVIDSGTKKNDLSPLQAIETKYIINHELSHIVNHTSEKLPLAKKIDIRKATESVYSLLDETTPYEINYPTEINTGNTVLLPENYVAHKSLTNGNIETKNNEQEIKLQTIVAPEIDNKQQVTDTSFISSGKTSGITDSPTFTGISSTKKTIVENNIRASAERNKVMNTSEDHSQDFLQRTNLTLVNTLQNKEPHNDSNVVNINNKTTQLLNEIDYNLNATGTLKNNNLTQSETTPVSTTQNYLGQTQNGYYLDVNTKDHIITNNQSSPTQIKSEKIIVNASATNIVKDIHGPANAIKLTETVKEWPETSVITDNVPLKSIESINTIPVENNKTESIDILASTLATTQQTTLTPETPLKVTIVNVQNLNSKKNNLSKTIPQSYEKDVHLEAKINPMENIKLNVSNSDNSNKNNTASVSNLDLDQTIVTVRKITEDPIVSLASLISDKNLNNVITDSTTESSHVSIVKNNDESINDMSDSTKIPIPSTYTLETTTLQNSDNLGINKTDIMFLETSSKQVPATVINTNQYVSISNGKETGDQQNTFEQINETNNTYSSKNETSINGNIISETKTNLIPATSFTELNSSNKSNNTTVTNTSNVVKLLLNSSSVRVNINQTEPMISKLSPTPESMSNSKASSTMYRPVPLVTTEHFVYVTNTEPTVGPVKRGLVGTIDSQELKNKHITGKDAKAEIEYNTNASTSNYIKEPVHLIKNNDGQIIKDNEEITKSTTFSLLSTSSSNDPIEIITISDVSLDSKTGSEFTHSGIISLSQPSKSQNKKESSKTKENDKEDQEKHPSYLELAPLQYTGTSKIQSTEISTTTDNVNKVQKNMTTREEMIIKNKSYNYNISINTKLSPNFNDGKILHNNTNSTVSGYKKEATTRELIENSTTSTNDSHTSNNKSQDENTNILQQHNKTIISNDQSSTSRYVSQTKSSDAQTTEFPSLELSTRKLETNQLFCKQKKRGRYSDELDCRKFYICLGNKSSHIIEGICPVNTVFSEINKQCTKNLSHCIRNNQFRCVTEGRFGDFLNDNVYYICIKNSLSQFIRFKLQCQNGYHLNKTSVRCDLNSESTSSGDSKSVSEQSSSSTKPNKSEKPEKPEKSEKKFKCKKEGFFPDPSNCNKYYECIKVDSSYQLKKKKCDSDEIFHKDKKKCVDSDSFEC